LVEQQPSDEASFQINSETNRCLHCMAAHLHRYGSELSLTSDIVQDLKKYNTDYHQTFVDNGLRPHHPTEGLEAIIRGIDQISSQLSAIRAFRDELQLKTTNVLALVRLLFHNHVLYQG
jgi:hypothetical protein